MSHLRLSFTSVVHRSLMLPTTTRMKPAFIPLETHICKIDIGAALPPPPRTLILLLPGDLRLTHTMLHFTDRYCDALLHSMPAQLLGQLGGGSSGGGGG